MLANPAICGSSVPISMRLMGIGTKMSPRNQSVALAKSQHHVINPTNLGGALDDGVEYRLHVRGRAADDTEHLGSRCLMFEGFAQFRVALLQFFEQPDVLDRDNGLVGESFYESDLLFRKGWTSVRRMKSIQ